MSASSSTMPGTPGRKLDMQHGFLKMIVKNQIERWVNVLHKDNCQSMPWYIWLLTYGKLIRVAFYMVALARMFCLVLYSTVRYIQIKWSVVYTLFFVVLTNIVFLFIGTSITKVLTRWLQILRKRWKSRPAKVSTVLQKINFETWIFEYRNPTISLKTFFPEKALTLMLH